MKSIKEHAVSGVSWTSLSSGSLILLQVIQTAVLTRLIAKGDFGLRSMVTVIVGFVTIYADMGIGNAIVHHQDMSEKETSTLYWLNILVGIVAYLIVIAISPLVVLFYNEPSLYQLIPIGGITFILSASYGIHSKMLEKNLDFKSMAKISVIANTIGVLSTIIFAYFNFGVFSLLYGQIIQFFIKGVMTVFIVSKFWKPRFVFDFQSVKGYLRFGLYQMGERTVNYLSRNLDKILLGGLLGKDVLGLYTVAFNLVLMPIMKINPLLTKVAFPVFSKIQNKMDSMKRGYLQMIKFIGFINFPLLMGLIVVADQFALQFLGSEFASSVFVIQILAVVAMFRSIGNPVSSLLLARGKVKTGFLYNTIKICLQIPVVYLFTSTWSMNGLLFAMILIQVITFFAHYYFLVKPCIEITFREFLQAILSWGLFSGIMGGAIWIAKYYLIGGINVPHFVFAIMVGVISYAGLVLLFQRNYVKFLLNLFIRKKK